MSEAMKTVTIRCPKPHKSEMVCVICHGSGRLSACADCLDTGEVNKQVAVDEFVKVRCHCGLAPGWMFGDVDAEDIEVIYEPNKEELSREIFGSKKGLSDAEFEDLFVSIAFIVGFILVVFIVASLILK